MAKKVDGLACLDGMVSFLEFAWHKVPRLACWGQQLVAKLGYILFGLLGVEKQSRGLLVNFFFPATCFKEDLWKKQTEDEKEEAKREVGRDTYSLFSSR
ncbi:hypothetical protein PRUPE_3G119900 [Prunus persica]|uniref:Uncharacterized protein n=1 Tax=Prunus persica TaxID=3760 RepID=A0A251Q250_PRUPE|nr:hypothetical protein PRUPE_3G119900 [Prunus persica]ONI16756.1 hypothetical protein PRUPE_3G119900 [Prunus persica]